MSSFLAHTEGPGDPWDICFHDGSERPRRGKQKSTCPLSLEFRTGTFAHLAQVKASCMATANTSGAKM